MDGPEAVLIIEPDARRRAFARDVLDHAGYDVRAAANEAEATGLLDGWQPALVVAPMPPNTDQLSSCPVVTVAAPGAAFNRAGLLAAVWVTLNP